MKIYFKNIFVNEIKNIFYFVTLLILFGSCKKDPIVRDDYFAFGDAHGECLGNCANFFLLKSNKLYADDIDQYSYGKLKFQRNALPSNQFEIARILLDNFPQFLKDHADTTFGCPDCVDQGGIHIEARKNGKTMFWHIDNLSSQIPAEIRNYVSDLRAVLTKLKK